MQVGGLYTIDFAKISEIPKFTVKLKTGDKKRFIKLILLENNICLDLNRYTIVVTSKKEDDATIFNSVKKINTENGMCEIEITEQMLVESTLKCEIILYDKFGGISKSSDFILEILPSVCNYLNIINSSEFTALEEALFVVANINNKIDRDEKFSIFQIDKNKGKIDETFLSDALIAQIAGNSPVSPTVADYSITQSKMAFPVLEGIPSKNLFDKNNIILDKYVDENSGHLLDSVDMFTSAFIIVVQNEFYYKNSSQRFALYDANKNFIKGGIGNLIETTSNACYVRFCELKNNIDSIQLEKGREGTSYEKYTAYVAKNNLRNKSITKDKLDFETLDLTKPKNLLDKSKCIKNAYINFENGNCENVEGFYASDFIEVLPTTTYTKTTTQQLAFYDIDKKFISGVNFKKTFTTPSNCAYIRITIEAYALNYYQIEKGTIETEFEEHIYKVPLTAIPNKFLEKTKNIVIVSKDSNNNFSTINEAINKSEHSKENPLIIILMAGVYIESINLVGKYVTILGVNKDICIIKTYTNDYYHPPLDCSAHNYISNVTVIADDDGTTTPQAGVNGLPAYALHFDISGRYDINDESNQGIARFNNVIFISKHQHAAGCGLSHQQHLVFENCEFVAYNDPAFRVHNYMNAGATNQKLTVKNCTMHNNSNYKPIILQDPNNTEHGANDNTDTVFVFSNTIAYNDVSQSDVVEIHQNPNTGCLVGNIKLGFGSFGNSDAKLNK